MFWRKRIKIKEIVYIFLLTLAALPAIWGLLGFGFPVTDDADWLIIRFTAFYQALIEGQLPTRWLGRLNHGYGYPVANFNYPGFMYLASFFKLLGFGYLVSIKFLLVGAMIFSAVFTYLWLKKIFKPWPAFTGALFYLYSPYHLFDLYKRGSVGEILTMAVAPFVFWVIEKKNLFWISLGLAFLILSHNILALLFFPVLTFYLYKRAGFWAALETGFWGLGLSAFFWLPALFDLRYTRFFSTPVAAWRDHFADLKLVGFLTLAILGILLLAAFKQRKPDWRTSLFAGLAIAGVFLALPESALVWRALPVSIIQYPFRFLSLTVLGVGFLAAKIIEEFKGVRRILVGILLIGVLFFSSRQFSRSLEYVDRGDLFYATNEDSTTIKNEYMPRWVKSDLTERAKERVEIVKGSGAIMERWEKNKAVEFEVLMRDKGRVRLNTIYFPGWKVFVNGKERTILYENDKGVMEVELDKGENKVKFVFGETPARLLADAASLAFLGVLSAKSLLRSHLGRGILFCKRRI